ncbi:HAD family hydrolase [Thalassomonas sp. M1454]|uniref:HAD family hydrolase n=1 Tax=Thalassomonas sp. M1454 TaxID=2594477 RepID=UPI00117CEB24|nr:HAD-IA family hydrolase [Thalassomonas sp. M1454]TRX56625.1 HAD-IA family hydrolase [Thalassomonas sp. M1454]
MPNIKGVLFDLDGTLLDTAKDLGASLNYLMDKYGFAKVSYDEYRLVASDGVYPLLDLGFKEQLQNFDKEVLRQEFLDYYLANIAAHTQLFPGIKELLAYLDEQSIPWGIVTNKPEFLTTPLLKCFAELELSKSNISGDTLPQRKPHPAPMLLASNELGVACEDIYYLGDAERDIIAGNACEMKTVVANWGYLKYPNEGNSWQADHIIDQPMQLLQLAE